MTYLISKYSKSKATVEKTDDYYLLKLMKEFSKKGSGAKLFKGSMKNTVGNVS